MRSRAAEAEPSGTTKRIIALAKAHPAGLSLLQYRYALDMNMNERQVRDWLSTASDQAAVMQPPSVFGYLPKHGVYTIAQTRHDALAIYRNRVSRAVTMLKAARRQAEVITEKFGVPEQELLDFEEDNSGS